jgi:hypothetical protein
VDDVEALAPVALGDVGADRLAASVGLWAWYGHWQDKNGNGVLDDHGPACTGSPEICNAPWPEDEWTWVGNCLRYSGGPGWARPGLCKAEPTSLATWVWPGNHHAEAWGSAPDLGHDLGLPADAPGHQALCAAQGVAEDALGPLRGRLACPGRLDDLDAWSEGHAGDPLLDDPGSLRPDLGFDDRTGDPSPYYRHWLGGNGWPMGFYDDGLLTTTVFVTAVFAPPCAPCDVAALPGAALADVDRFPALHPLLDGLVQGAVKPAARSAWVQARALL